MNELNFKAKFVRSYQPGDMIFREGDPGTHMYVVSSGQVDIIKVVDGMPTHLVTMKAGDIFGEMALIDDLPRSATAIATGEGAELMEIDHALFVYLVGQQPAFALVILKALSLRLRAKTVERAATDGPQSPGPRTSGKGNGEVTQLKENIFQLRGKCMSYLVRGTRKNLLVDTGVPADIPQLEAQLQSLGLTPDDINILILTHEHMDHIGCMPLFSHRTVIGAHVMAANKVALQDEFVLMSEAYKLEEEKFNIDLHLHHGTCIDLGGTTLQIYHTPGHCSGSICLYEPDQQILFTGDTIFAGGVLGGIFPSGSISDYTLTLRQLSKLKLKEIYPGHGRVSQTPEVDFDKAIKAAMGLAADTRSLFGALDTRDEFTAVYKAISAYSRRT